ncbi:MAG: hypothetical protein HYZ93_00135 [Candidatus Omnitrophica bacterium]|nr:hypothetical protein [Candidatus Omnitrophota bacterium]
MISPRLTNLLLGLIALASLAHLAFALLDRPVMAETFRLDSCITEKPNQKPLAYLHVVTHSQKSVDATP